MHVLFDHFYFDVSSMQNTEETITEYAVDAANLFRLGSTNPKKYPGPRCFQIFEFIFSKMFQTFNILTIFFLQKLRNRLNRKKNQIFFSSKSDFFIFFYSKIKEPSPSLLQKWSIFFSQKMCNVLKRRQKQFS